MSTATTLRLPEFSNETSASPESRDRNKIAYIMSAFPMITETFILYEILAIRELGTDVQVFPLRRLRARIIHPEVKELRDRVHFCRPFSLQMLSANWYFFRRRPWMYFKTMYEVLSGTFGSRKFFFKSCAAFPIAVYFAYKIQQLGIRHVHAHFANHPTLAALVIFRLTGIPYSFTAHGSDLHVDRKMLDQKVAAAEFVVTISDFNKRVILEECGEDVSDKVHVVHCGIDSEVFQVARKPDTSQQLRIVCVAALKDVKGHKYLIGACRLLKNRNIDFVCNLIGEGPERSAIEAQVDELGLENEVNLLGAGTRNDVIQLLTDANVAVLPSVPTKAGKREGIPVSLMEAMASGLPVVASRLSGIPELVDDDQSGILVAPTDIEGLAAALERLGKDPALRKRLGAAGQIKVLNEFNLRDSTLRRNQLYLKS